MADATVTPIPRLNRRRSQARPRPQTQGWDSLIEKAFAQQPTPTITPRNSMLTTPAIPMASIPSESSLPARPIPYPRVPSPKPDTSRKTPPPRAQSPAHQALKDHTPRPSSPASTVTKFSPLGSSLELPPDEQEDSLDPIWAKVRAKKLEKMMALPSKVKSLEGHVGEIGNVVVGLLDGMGKLGKVREEREEEEPKETKKVVKEEKPEGDAGASLAPKAPDAKIPRKVSGPKKTLARRPSMVTFKESADGLKAIAIFDMAGVRKQDMHVTYRVGPVRLVVVWRRIRIIEKMEEHVLVRERQEKQYSQIVPLLEGTKFKDIKATRDGKRLTLTYPNPQPSSRIVSIDSLETLPTTQVHSPKDIFELKAEAAPETLQTQVPQTIQSEQSDPLPPEQALSEAGETEFYTCIQIDGDDDWSPYSTPSKR